MLVVGALLAACGNSSDRGRSSSPTLRASPPSTDTPTVTPTSTPAATTPKPKPTPGRTSTPPALRTPSPSRPHVLLIMLENKGYAATLGTCSADPYLARWLRNTEPHEQPRRDASVGPNYVAFDSGAVNGCTTDSSCKANSLSQTDLGGQLTAAGVPWSTGRVDAERLLHRRLERWLCPQAQPVRDVQGQPVCLEVAAVSRHLGSRDHARRCKRSGLRIDEPEPDRRHA